MNVSGLGGTGDGDLFARKLAACWLRTRCDREGRRERHPEPMAPTGIDAEGGAIQITVGGATIASTGGGDAFGLKASGYSANITTTGGVPATFNTPMTPPQSIRTRPATALSKAAVHLPHRCPATPSASTPTRSSGNVIVGLGYASAQSVDGDATGIDATAQKSVIVYDTGTIFVFTRYGAATGAYVHGTQGNVGLSAEEAYACSLNGAATGVHSVASVGYDNDVTSTHFVRVQAEGAATGVYAYGGNIESRSWDQRHRHQQPRRRDRCESPLRGFGLRRRRRRGDRDGVRRARRGCPCQRDRRGRRYRVRRGRGNRGGRDRDRRASLFRRWRGASRRRR